MHWPEIGPTGRPCALHRLMLMSPQACKPEEIARKLRAARVEDEGSVHSEDPSSRRKPYRISRQQVGYGLGLPPGASAKRSTTGTPGAI